MLANTIYIGSDLQTDLSNLTDPTAINESLLPEANNTLDMGSNLLRFKDAYIADTLTVFDLVVESGSSIKLAGATFENEGHYTSVDTNWMVKHDDTDTAFIGVYAENASVFTHANLLLDAQGSACNMIKNSPSHMFAPGMAGITNEDGNFGIFVDHSSEISFLHYETLVKDEQGNITNMTGMQTLGRFLDAGEETEFQIEHGTNDACSFFVDDHGDLRIIATGNKVGIGSPSEPSAHFEVYGAAEPQLRLAYDDNNDVTFDVDSIGDLAIDTTGDVTFNSDVTSGGNVYSQAGKLIATDEHYQYVTGWLEGGLITINSGDNTLIDIAAGAAVICDYTDQASPTITPISWDAQVGLDPELVGRSKWVGVKDNNGSVEFVYDVDFDSTERRSNAIIGRIWDSAGAGPQITNVGEYERPNWQLTTAFQDFILEFGSWNIAGNTYSANGTNLYLDKASGKSYRYNAENVPGVENIHTDNAQIPRTPYAYHLQGSSTVTSETTIDPDYYDNAGVKTAIGSNKFSLQELWFFPVSGTCHVLYGQMEHSSLADAVAAISSETKIRNSEILSGAILRGYLAMREGTTDLSDTADCEIREAVGMGGGGGGGGAAASYWDRENNTLSTATSGDDVELGGLLKLTGTNQDLSIRNDNGDYYIGGWDSGLIFDKSNQLWQFSESLIIGQDQTKGILYISAMDGGTGGATIRLKVPHDYDDSIDRYVIQSSDDGDDFMMGSNTDPDAFMFVATGATIAAAFNVDLSVDGDFAATGTISGSNSSDWDTAYSWGNHAGLYDEDGDADAAVTAHESTYSHTSYDIAYTHSQDNSQAHTDYLVNNNDDETTGKLTVGSLISNGAVGIGIDDPERHFHIQNENATLRIDRDRNSPAVMMHRFPTGDYTTPLKGFIFGVNASAADEGSFFISDFHQDVSGGGSDQRFTIDTDGKIGINELVPDCQFHVNSGEDDLNAKFESTNGRVVIELSDSLATAYLTEESSILSLGFTANANINNLNVKPDGKVGIGTIAPTAPLHINHSGSGDFLKVHRGSNSYFVSNQDSTNNDLRLTGSKINRVGTGDATDLVFMTNLVERAKLWVDGTFTVYNKINTPELYNSEGTLKIQPDVQGDVDLFGDTDVDNAVDGKELRIWRRAAEGNEYFRLYITSTKFGMIHSSAKMTLQGQDSFTINSVNDSIYLKVGDNAGAESINFRNSDNDNLVEVSSNGKVGIGINPTDKLHVYNGNLCVERDDADPSLYLTDNDDNDTFGFVHDRSASAFMIVAGNNDRNPSFLDDIMTFQMNHFVGIGCTPTVEFEVNKSTKFDKTVGIGVDPTGIPLEVHSSDDKQIMCMDTTALAQGTGGGIAFGGVTTSGGAQTLAAEINLYKTNATSGDYGFDMHFESMDSAGNITPRMEFRSNGNCAIGDFTSTTASKTLDVLGDARVRGDLTVDDNVVADLFNNMILEEDDYGNTYIGEPIPAGLKAGDGMNNTILGRNNGMDIVDGTMNFIMGSGSGNGIIDGMGNIVIGSSCGNDVVGTSSDIEDNNIIIGFSCETITGKHSNSLNLANVIWGDLGVGHVRIGGGQGTAMTADAAFEINSTNGALLVPRMTTTQRTGLAAVNGMIIYDTSQNAFRKYENGAWASL